MSRMKQIRQQAPVLLSATKDALRFLRSLDPHELPEEEDKRQAVMRTLAEAINTAEPPAFDERDTTVRLTMTPPSWRELSKILADRATRNKDDKMVYDAAHEGLRETKQRAYVTLAINPVILRRLHFILKHTAPANQEKSFERMAKQIEEDGLSKNPMEILAKMAL
jgi:type I site-specific restriction endonuclease